MTLFFASVWSIHSKPSGARASSCRAASLRYSKLSARTISWMPAWSGSLSRSHSIWESWFHSAS